MGTLALIPVYLLLGYFLARSGRFPKHTPQYLGRIIIFLPMPAMTLLNIHQFDLARESVSPAFMPWILYLVGALFFFVIGRNRGWDRRTIGALILTCGLGNTAFIGYPVIHALYGEPGVRVAIIADQGGTFMVLSTLGLLTAAFFSAEPGGARFPSAAKMARGILLFPPFLALLAGLALRPVEFPPLALQALRFFGGLLAPLALISVGHEWNPAWFRRLREGHPDSQGLALGLLYKLALAPLLIGLVFAPLRGAHPLAYDVTVLESAMAPMITAGIIATEYRLNPGLVSMLLGLGTPLSFLTLALWRYLLQVF